MRKAVFLLTVMFGILFSSSLQAQFTESVTIHGFGGWAIGYTNNENNYQFATNDADWDNYYFSLNIGARPVQNLSINSQINVQRVKKWRRVETDSTVIQYEDLFSLDYIFAQYTLSEQFNFRAGKIQSPFGLYTEIYDVGTLRPFYTLPASVYLGLFPKSYVGVGLTGAYDFNSAWGIVYDVVLGEIRLNEFALELPVEYTTFQPPFGPPVTYPSEFGKFDSAPLGKEMIGAQVTVSTPIEGLKTGLAYINFDGYTSKDSGVKKPSGYRLSLATINIEYLTEKFLLRTEAYKVWEEQKAYGSYLEVAYMLFDHWQIAAQTEYYRMDSETTKKYAEYFPSVLEHRTYGVGLNYWFNSNLTLKANYYWITGNAFAQPDWIVASLPLVEKTNTLIIGTQFSF